jgi:hypothetical protein
MPFNTSTLSEARKQGATDDDIYNHLIESDDRFRVAKEQGASLDEIASHIQTQGGEQPNEDQISSQSETKLDNDEQRKSDEQKQSANEAGLQPGEVRLPQLTRPKERVGNINASGQVEGGEVTSEEVTKTEGQGTQEGSQDGEGLRGQVPSGNQEEVTAGGVQPPKGYFERLVSGAKEKPAEAAKVVGSAVAETGAGLAGGTIAAALMAPAAAALTAGTGGLAVPLSAGLEMGAFAAGSYVGNKAAKLIESAIGVDKDIEEAQQAQPELAQTAGIATILPMGVKSVAELAKLTGKEALKRVAGGAAGGAAFEPIRYGVEKGIQTATGSEEEVAPITAESIGESALIGAALSGMGARRIAKEVGPETAKVAATQLTDAEIAKRFEEVPAETITLEPVKEETKPPVSGAENKPEVTATEGQATKEEVKQGEVPEGYIEEGLHQEYPNIGEAVNKYSSNNDATGIGEALADESYEDYYSALQSLLKSYLGDNIIVSRKEGYAGGSGEGVEQFASVSTLPTWRGKKYIIPREDVILAGNEAEGELIVKRDSLKLYEEKPKTESKPVSTVSEWETGKTPEGSRIAAAAYLAPDSKTYEGSSHLDAMQKAKEAGAITQEEIDAKQTPESRNTEEFGYAVTLPDGTRTTTTREAGAEIARASGQAQEEPFTFGEKMHSNETKKDDFPETKAGEVPPDTGKPYDEVVPPPAGSVDPTVMRGVSERIASDKDTSPELKYQIEADDLVKRRVLADEDADAWVESVPSEQLESTFNKAMTSIGENENLSKLRVRLGSRFFNERLAAGDESGAGRIINLIAKTASDAASVLRSVQFLYKATPAGFQRLVQKMGEKAGVVIKDKTMQKIGDLSNDFLAKKKLHEDLANKAQNSTTKLEYRQTLKEMKKAGSEALKAQNKLFSYVDSIMPKSLTQDVYPTLIKGNLLTPISIATNIQANALRTVLDVPSMLTASGMDAARALLTGKKREFVYGPKEVAEYFKTLALHAPKMVFDIVKSVIRSPLGIGETTNKAEIKQKLSPWSALKRLAQSKDDRLYEGTYSLKQRASDLAEGIFGVPANVFFDLLAAGDAPFRTAAKRMTASSIAREIGLKGLEYEKFLDLPEKGIREYAKKVGKDTSDASSIQRKLLSSYNSTVKQSVFEQDNIVANKVNELLKLTDKLPGLNIAIRATIPYVKTPLNLVSEVAEYTIWPYAMVKGLGQIKKGKIKEAQQLFAKSAIGAATSLGAAYLAKNGVLTPPADPRSKEKELGYATMPESSLNISGIQRLINGESGAVQAGDTIVRADKLGLLGSILVTSALREKMKEKTTLMEGKQSIDARLYNEIAFVIPKALSFVLGGSILKGTNDLLTSLIKGDGDQWMKSVFSATSAAFIPNSLSAISRATREYMPDMNDDSFYKKMENTIRDRFGFAGATEGIPLKLDFWGRPIKQTPEGANPIFYNFMDMSKSRSIPNDPVSLEMLHLFHATGNKEIIPPSPQKKFTVKNTTYGLTPDEYTSYAQKVGQERRKLMERLVSSPSYLRMPDDRKADAFERNIRLGKKIGTSKFLREVKESGGFKGQVMKLSPKELTQRIQEQRAETKAEEALTSE